MNWNPKLTAREMYCLTLGAFLGVMLVLPATLAFYQNSKEPVKVSFGQYVTPDATITRVIGLSVTNPDIMIAEQDFRGTMPCGTPYSFAKGEPFPKEDIPCPCGDPRHWLFQRRSWGRVEP